MNNPYKSYQENSINTAKPEELTLILYNGCLKFIRLAKIAIQSSNFQEKHNNIVKAQNIIRELMLTLNQDYEISKSIMPLYDYILNKLIESNVKNSVMLLEEVESFVLDLRDTWKEAIKIAKK